MTRRRTTITLKGGLNTTSPDDEIAPGQAIHAVNVEQGLRGGYRRIDGYERFDGRALPSSVSYWKVACSALTVAIVAGQVLTIGSATAVTMQDHSATDLFLYLSSPDTIPADTAVVYDGSTVSTSEDPITSRYESDSADMVLWDAAMAKWRDQIQKVPGSGDIRGVAMREGEVVAFRDNVAGTEGVGHKAVGTFSVGEKQILNSTTFEIASSFGRAIYISGDGTRAIVGAYSEDLSGLNQGAAYVYVKVGGVWLLEARLTASDLQDGDFFGVSVAMSSDGTRVAIGASSEDGAGANRGAAYVFTRSGTTWSEEQKLTASDTSDGDFFGSALDINSDGSTLIVGTVGEDGSGSDRGAVYVFTRSGVTWAQEQKIVASDTENDDNFGYRISVSDDGNTVVVGTPFEDGSGSDRGAVYVFTRSGVTWAQEQKIVASDTANNYYFGTDVSLSSDGDTLVVGSNGSASGGGSAYIFTRSSTVWTEQQIITALDAAANDSFGTSLMLSDNTIVVGAYSEDGDGSNRGAVYVFYKDDTLWVQKSKLTASGASDGDTFGEYLGVSSDGLSILVGLAGTVNQRALFFKVSHGWESITDQDYQEQELIEPDYIESGDYFGQSVSIDNNGKNLAIGSPYDDEKSTDSGLVQLMERYGADWTETDRLFPPNLQEGAKFGMSVSLEENGLGLLIGAPETDVLGTEYLEKQKFTDGSNGFGYSCSLAAEGTWSVVGVQYGSSNSAVIYTRVSSVWEEDATVTSFGSFGDSVFGQGTAISSDGLTVLVTDRKAPGAGTNRGALYMYVKTASGWDDAQALTSSDISDSDFFGQSVAVSYDGDVVVVGAPYVDGAGTNRGAVYIFTRSGDTLTEIQILTASDAGDGALFGWGVDISADGSTIAVGAPNDSPGAFVRGSAYVFTRSGDTWMETQKLEDNAITTTYNFGSAIRISEDNKTIVLGCLNFEEAYIFVENGGVWTEQATIKPLDTLPEAGFGSLFGISIAISADGNLILAGAKGRDGVGQDRGAAYLFERVGVDWTQSQKLVASDTLDSGFFGVSLDIAPLVGTMLVTSNKYSGSSIGGAAYYFSLSLFDQGTAEYYTKGELGWGYVETINSDTSTDSDKFGQTVKLSDDGFTMAVAAPYRSKNNLANAGYVSVYELDPTWILRSEISLDVPAANDYFGYSIDLSKEGKVLVVGQYGKSVSSNAGAGSCSIYDKTQGEWTLTQTIDTPNPEASGNFGFSVAVSADGLVLAIGAPNEDALGTDDGRIYIYELASGTWSLTQTTVLEGSSGNGNDLSLGHSVDLNEDGSILTAHQGDSSESGMLNVFIRHNDYWAPTFRKTSSDSNSDDFGHGVQISPNGDYIACAAPATDTNTGQAFVFNKSGAALAAAGSYDFDNYNFIGGSTDKNLYGADGVNLGFEYDGTTYKQIRTGMDIDTPTHVLAHKQHLFFSYGPSVQHSSLGDPHEWLIITGAAEISIGDDITGFERLRGGELAIFGRNETNVLYGTSTLDWQLSEFSIDTGAAEWTIQAVGYPVYLDDRGIAMLPSVQEHGDFARSAVSELIDAIVNELRGTATASTISRNKNQYRVFFTNGLGLILTINSRSEVSILPVQYDDTVLKTVSEEGTDGAEQMYFGSSSGYIFRMDSGISFDGSAFESTFRLPRNDFEFPQYKKKLLKGEIYLKAEGYTSFDMTPDLEYESSDNPTELATTYTVTDPSGFWTGQGIDVNKSSRVRADIKGIARAISMIFSSNSKLIYPCTINTVAYDWTFRKKVN